MLTTTNQHKSITIKVLNSTYIENYLLLWKGYLELTDGDIKVLIEFIIIFNKIKLTNNNDDLCFIEVFNKESRKSIMTKLKISEYSFNNIFMRLKKKTIIQKTKYGYRLKSAVIPVDNITFNFKLEDV